MPTKRLPRSASLRHLKHQAKDLLSALRAGQPSACQRVRSFHPGFAGLTDEAILAATFTLSDAQLSLAREYGYASWPRLKAVVSKGVEAARVHNDRIEDIPFRQAVDLIDEGNETLLQRHLRAHPGLVDQQVRFEGDNYFVAPYLLEFIAENPTRQERLPSNIVAIARILLEAGAKAHQVALDNTLGLVASGRVARECGVQRALLDILVDFGAVPGTALLAAGAHGEFDAARHLLKRGAPLDAPTAAALGMETALAALVPGAAPEVLQLCLSLAALHGHAKICAQLLEAGADANRYNPEGVHGHCTPLHNAALEGHLETVQVLLAAGARRDTRDIHHQATARDWALHAGHADVAAALGAGD